MLVAVFQCFAEGVVQMKPIVGSEIGALQLALHGRFVLDRHDCRLEIGKAPVSVAQARRQIQSAPVPLDRLLTPA